VSSNNPKLHLYGQNAAVTIEGSSKQTQDGAYYTVNLDVAPKPDDRVDWSRKISLQLSPQELVLMCGILLGYAPKAHFQRPGKGIHLERQPDKVFISASAGQGNRFALPLNIGDTQRAADLLIHQLVRGSFTGSVESVLAGVRGACALLKSQ